MATITVRGLDDLLHARLKLRAAQNGRSMEEEARMILRQTLEPKTEDEPRTGHDFVMAMRKIAAEYGYWDDIDVDEIRADMNRDDRRMREVQESMDTWFVGEGEPDS